jgi:O-antigen ligase
MTALVAFLFVALPWLNPFSPGPTPAVGPFLFSWTCAALLWIVLVFGSLQNPISTAAKTVALAWLASAGVSAVIGLLQYFGITAWAGSWVNHTGLSEAYGNLRQRNQFATLMNIGLAALLWWVASTRRASTHPVQRRTTLLLAVLIGALLGAGNAASSSRTGLIQLCLLALITWAWQHRAPSIHFHTWRPRPIYQVLLVCLVAYAVAAAALPLLAGLDPLMSGAWARLRTGDAACSSRMTLWRNVLHLIAQKPWMGWGWGELDYAHFITLYPGERFCDILDNAHNLPLHLAVELGLPMALLTCGVAAWLVWRAQPWRESDATRQLAWSVLAVIGLHSLLEYPLWYGPFQIAALLSIWLLWRSSQRRAATPAEHITSRLTFYPQVSSGLLLMALCGFVAWEYQLVSQIYLPPQARLADYRDDTLKKIGHVALFQDQVRFADLTTTELDVLNAQTVHDLALDMLHFSPEARVVELVLDSAKLLGHPEEVNFYAARYKAAFPQAYAHWLATPGTK